MSNCSSSSGLPILQEEPECFLYAVAYAPSVAYSGDFDRLVGRITGAFFSMDFAALYSQEPNSFTLFFGRTSVIFVRTVSFLYWASLLVVDFPEQELRDEFALT